MNVIALRNRPAHLLAGVRKRDARSSSHRAPYDAAGNRISLTRANGTANNLPAAVQAAYDAANEQTQFAGAMLQYDANGNLTNDGTNTYTWDSRNRLTAISGPGLSTSFVYDALGRRVSKTINGVTTQFLYDGNDIVQEIDGGAVAASYVRSLNIDEPFVRQTSTNEFYHADAVGSILALTNQTGAAGISYSYETFGKTTVTGTSSNPFQFTGRENDNTGLYYYRSRYYSPPTSRFSAEDPLYSPLLRVAKCQKSYAPDVTNYAESDRSLALLMMFRFYRVTKNAFAANPQKIPLYVYAENNPTNEFDPMGLIAGPQNLGCDLVPDILEGRCTFQCCNEHDDCYKRRRSFCDFTSWLDVGARFTRPDCLSCNRAVVQCIARNVFKGKKDLCDLTDF